MSFRQDLPVLNDDDFEGLNNEIRISQEVFYGIDSPAGSEKHELNGFINFGCQQHKFVGSSPSSNTGSLTSEASSKGSCPKDGNNVHGASLRTSPSASFTEGFLLAERKDHAVPAKRMKLSVDELSSFKPLLQKALASEIPLKKIVSGVHHPKFCLDCQIVMSHVVESSSEGVRSSCYLLKQGFETEKKGCLGDRGLPTDNLLGSEGSEGKEIVVSNAIASPVSQESCATKILVASLAGANVDETGSCQRAVRKRKKGTPVELDEDHTPWTSDCTKELRPLLRRQIFHLLAASGWSIEKRKRQCRTYEEFVFISPEERPVRELSKAWSLCGQILLAHEYKQMQAQDGRQWTNIDEFCSDLFSTLTNMDNGLKHQEPKAALARQWVLLDPFVTVVFVDRKIKDLRAGNVVKAKHNASDTCEKSVVVGKGKRSDVRCAMKKLCDSSLASESTVIDFSRQSQGGEVEASMSRSIYVSEGNCMRLLETVNKIGGNSNDLCMKDSRHQCSPAVPAFGSGITCLQPASYLYDVPAESGNVDLTDGVSKKFSARQDDASDVVMHGPSQLCAEDAKHRWCFDSSSLRNSGTDGCLDSNSKGKSPKKSKISEIELTSFSEDEILNMSTPCRVEDDAQKMNYYTKKANNKAFKKMPSNTKSYRKKTPKVKSLPCQLQDDDLLISAIVQKKGFRSYRSNCSVKPGAKLRPLKKRKSHKRGCRLLPRNLGKGGKHFPDGRWSLIAERTVLSWLFNTGVIFPNEIIQYRDSKDETVVKDGLITRDGILCKCCNKVHSVSEFKVHAGLEMNRLCLNLFTDSGQPFTLHLLEAWSAEYKARKAGLRAVQSDEFDQNDDSCGLCGDGGELLCCDNCPSTFHQSCLSAEELPEGSWYCASCTCWICWKLVDDEASSAHFGFKCCQCEHKYHVVCLKELGVDRTISNLWFCSGSCEEVHSGLQSRVGLCNLISDGFSWSVLRCIDDDQKVHSAQRFALKAECNSKLAVALTIMEECFVSMVDARTGIDMIPQVVYNWGSEFPRLDYHGFYTVVLEKNDVLISVASIRVHGVKVAEMPLVATCSKYRRKGMCRRLLNAIEQMLISLKVEKLVITAIPHLVETWTVGFGFVPVEEEEKRSLNKINLMVFPGTVMLKKTLYSGQTADLQGPGSAAGVSFVGMDKSIEEGASSREQCGSKRENDDRCGSEDLGGLNVKLGSLHDMEVVEAQRSPGSQRSESRDTDKAVSGGCMILPVCGHTKASDCCDVSPHKETGKAVQDMLRQAGSLKNVANGVIGNSTNCLFPQECSDSDGNKLEVSFNIVDEVGSKTFNCSVPQELAGMRTQHEESFGVENEIESKITTCPVLQEGADHGRKPLEVASNMGCEDIENCPFSQSAEPERMNTEALSNVVAEVEGKVTNPPAQHEGTDREKVLYETITSSVGNERECRKNTNLPPSQEGADLEETPQVVAVAPDEAEIKMPNVTVSEIGADQEVIEQEAAIINVSKAENKNNFMVLPRDEVHSVEADELPGTCINYKVDELGTIKEADTETGKVSQEAHASEPGLGLETERTVEPEPLEASSENNSSNPCSSAAIEAQNGCASDIETQFDTGNKLFLMDKLKKLVFWQNHSNTNR